MWGRLGSNEPRVASTPLAEMIIANVAHEMVEWTELSLRLCHSFPFFYFYQPGKSKVSTCKYSYLLAYFDTSGLISKAQ